MSDAVLAEPMRVALVREKGGLFLIEQVTLDSPRPNEVLVRVVASGLCHTDMVVRSQGIYAPLPMVLGHEGSAWSRRSART